MPKWLIYVIVLVIGAGIGYVYMSIQNQQLVERVSETETQLVEANKTVEEASAESEAAKAELAEKIKMIEEQASRITTLEAELAKASKSE